MASVRKFLSDLKDVFRSHKRGIVKLVIVLTIVFSVLGAIAFKASEQPWFCGACHNMTPYIDSWKVSSHKDVGCVACHYEPGFLNHLKGKLTDGQVSLVYFVTGKTPDKYHAEISDKSCLQGGCHKTEELVEEREFKGVRFSHPNHLGEMRRGKKLRCTTCHGQIVQGEHLTVDPRDCYICHFKPEENGSRHPVLADCTTCHQEVPMEILIEGRTFHHERYVDEGIECQTCHVDIVVGDGSLIENKCAECHNEPHFTDDKYSAEALHLNHVTNHKVECWRCHNEIEHRIVRNPTSKNFNEKCSTCHGGKEHLGPREMYKGTGGIGVEDSPAVMYKANVDCASCHIRSVQDRHALHSVDYKELALGEACESCHGEGYDSMLIRWKEVLTQEINDVNNRVFEVQKSLFEAKRGADTEEFRRAERLLAEARHNLNFVILGRGHHNIEYALKLLNVSRARTEEAKTLLVDGYRPQPIDTFEYSCANLCHTEMSRKKVKIGQADYPHKTHTEDLGLSCTDCHSTMDHHGETHLTLCNDCHHGEGEGAVGCGDCHQQVADLYAGRGANRVNGEPSFKYEMLECADCHQQVAAGEPTTREALKKACVECHDEKYAAVLENWETEVAKACEGQAERIESLRAYVSKEGRSGNSTLRARNLLLMARKNLALIESGRGVHNPEFAKSIAAANEGILDEVKALLKDGRH